MYKGQPIEPNLSKARAAEYTYVFLNTSYIDSRPTVLSGKYLTTVAVGQSLNVGVNAQIGFQTESGISYSLGVTVESGWSGPSDGTTFNGVTATHREAFGRSMGRRYKQNWYKYPTYYGDVASARTYGYTVYVENYVVEKYSLLSKSSPTNFYLENNQAGSLYNVFSTRNSMISAVNSNPSRYLSN